jgi:hypothetical protein
VDAVVAVFVVVIVIQKIHNSMGKELKKQTHLKPQDASSVDPSKLTSLTPEVVSSKSTTFRVVSSQSFR